MSNKTHTHFSHQFLRAFEPTLTSVLACIVVGAFIAIGQLLYISVQFGTILPTVFDGHLATAYTNYFVAPISRIIHAQSTAHLVIIALWGMGGLLIYELFSFVARESGEWRSATREQVFFQSPTSTRLKRLGGLAIRLVWRMSLIGIALFSVMAIRPLLAHIYATETQITSDSPVGQLLLQLGMVIALWAVLLHFGLVLARLFAFRTRLLEDEEVYS